MRWRTTDSGSQHLSLNSEEEKGEGSRGMGSIELGSSCRDEVNHLIAPGLPDDRDHVRHERHGRHGRESLVNTADVMLE